MLSRFLLSIVNFHDLSAVFSVSAPYHFYSQTKRCLPTCFSPSSVLCTLDFWHRRFTVKIIRVVFFSSGNGISLWRNSPTRARTASFLRFLHHIEWQTTVGPVLSTRDRPVAETSTWQQTTVARDIHVLGGIRTPKSGKREAANAQFRPIGHWDRRYWCI